MKKFEEGDEAILDINKAKKNGKFVSVSFNEVGEGITVEIVKSYSNRWEYPYKVTPMNIETVVNDYTQHVRDDWLTRPGEFCGICDSRKIFHDTEKRYFCPWCEK